MENGAVRSWGCAPASSRALTCPRCHGWTWLWLPAVLVLHSPLLRQPRCLPPWYWLTAMSSLPEKLRGRGREGGGRMWRGRSGGRKRNEIKEITCREDDKGEKQRETGMWGIMREETRLWKRRVVKRGKWAGRLAWEKYERTGLGEREKKSLIVHVVCRSNKSCWWKLCKAGFHFSVNTWRFRHTHSSVN